MHCQAIVTKFIGPTNHRGSRIKATAAAGSITVNWNYAHDVALNHALAAQALASRNNWHGVWVSGGLPNDAGDVFVIVSSTRDGLPAWEGFEAAFYVAPTA